VDSTKPVVRREDTSGVTWAKYLPNSIAGEIAVNGAESYVYTNYYASSTHFFVSLTASTGAVSSAGSLSFGK